MTRPKDRPDRDPHVAELGGFDITSLSVEQLRSEGVKTGGQVTTEVGKDPAWKTHSEFIADVLPEWDLIDRAYARAATAAHVTDAMRRAAEHAAEGHDMHAEELRARPLAGLTLPRSFPCLGMLRVAGRTGRVVEVSCDGCGETFGVAERKPEKDERRPTYSDGKTEGKWAEF